MAYTLEFQELYQYDDVPAGILVPIALRVGEQAVKLAAKLDTGAQYCVFQRQYGEQLGLRIEEGDPRSMVGPTGDPFKTFGHEVALEVLGYQVLSTAYFAEDHNFPRNVLGRNGWLNRFRVALIDYDRHLYLSAYDH